MILLVFIILFGFYLYFRRKSRSETEKKERKEEREGNFVCRVSEGRQQLAQLNSGVSFIPKNSNKYFQSTLWPDSSIGEFKINLRLGNEKTFETFEVIPDLGSPVLVISGPECINCNPNKGMWSSPLGLDLNRKKKKISYNGGQVIHYDLWKTTLPDYDAQPAEAGVITRTTVSKGESENILSLQSKSGFISSLGSPQKVIFDFPQQKFYLAKHLDDVLKDRVFLSTSLSCPSSGFRYALSPIVSMSVNGQSLPDSVCPSWALWDNGSTRTIVDSDLYSYLSTYYPSDPSKFEVEFPHSGSSTQKISFISTPYSVGSGELPLSKTILIGNSWLSQYGFGLDFLTEKVFFFQ